MHCISISSTHDSIGHRMFFGEDVLLTAATVLGWLLLTLAMLGTIYMLASAVVFVRFFGNRQAVARRTDAVTLLKPLCGREPLLEPNLASFLTQEHDGLVQLLCGVAHGDDPVVAAVESLRRSLPAATIDLVVSPVRHGASAKVSNLINMMAQAAHPVVILSDSDMVAAPDYLARVLAALDPPNVGAVTLLYHGRGDAGFWSTLGAAGISYQFLPGAAFGVALGLARPCMGSTIAMTRSTLDGIGGLAPFADVLADDYAIGEKVRQLGLEVAVPPVLIAHASAERSFAELWRHEVRWGATVRSVVPASYLGSVLSMPLPLAVLGVLLSQDFVVGGVVCLLALAARMLLVKIVDRRVGAPTLSPWLLPIRDFLTLAVFVASFFVRTVDWRGIRHPVSPSGQITPDTEFLA